MSEPIKHEGYWYTGSKSLLPKPVEGPEKPWRGRKRFLKQLAKIEKVAAQNHQKGSSSCRICKCKNGSSDFKFGGWQWPSGYTHYIKDHNLRPSLAFQEFVLGTNLLVENHEMEMYERDDERDD